MGSFVVAMPPPEQMKTAAQAKQLHQRLLDGQRCVLHTTWPIERFRDTFLQVTGSAVYAKPLPEPDRALGGLEVSDGGWLEVASRVPATKALGRSYMLSLEPFPATRG